MLFLSAGQILRKGKRVPGAGMEYPCEFRGKGSLLPAGNRGGCGAGGEIRRPGRCGHSGGFGPPDRGKPADCANRPETD